MNDDAPIIIVMMILILLLSIVLFGTYTGYYKLLRSEWKCKQAIVINDDPSNTECTMYVKTDKVVD